MERKVEISADYRVLMAALEELGVKTPDKVKIQHRSGKTVDDVRIPIEYCVRLTLADKLCE
jgi:hypothetical protein